MKKKELLKYIDNLVEQINEGLPERKQLKIYPLQGHRLLFAQAGNCVYPVMRPKDLLIWLQGFNEGIYLLNKKRN